MENKLNLDPQTILDKEFHVDFKGYSPAEVDEFLDSVIQDYQVYERVIGELGEKLRTQERTKARGKSMLAQSAMIVVFAPAQSIRPGSRQADG